MLWPRWGTFGPPMPQCKAVIISARCLAAVAGSSGACRDSSDTGKPAILVAVNGPPRLRQSRRPVRSASVVLGGGGGGSLICPGRGQLEDRRVQAAEQQQSAASADQRGLAVCRRYGWDWAILPYRYALSDPELSFEHPDRNITVFGRLLDDVIALIEDNNVQHAVVGTPAA